jgi:hypothetical protein
VVPSGVQEGRSEDLRQPIDFLSVYAQLIQFVPAQLIKKL